MGFQNALFGLCAVLIVTGCGVSTERKEELRKALDDGIPLANVIREPSGQETVFTGKIQPKQDFTSTFATRSDSGIECQGEFNSRGVGSILCTNGWRLNLQIPSDVYGTLHGTYVQTQDGIGSAVGWGNKADPELLRTLM